MTLPNPAFERACSLLTRRTQEGRFLLRPDPEATNAWLYATGLAAQEASIDLLGACLLANHKHDAIYDPLGHRTAYLERCHALLARSFNAYRGRRGTFFQAPSHLDKQTLFRPSDVLQALVYVLTNPVAAGLVDWPHQWPGLVGDWRQLLSVPSLATKPPFFYDREPPARGGLPEFVALQPIKPPCFAHLSDPDYEQLVKQTVEDRCRQLRAARVRPALGVRRALQVSPEFVPPTPLEPSPPRRFRGDPAFVELLAAAILVWLQAYSSARSRWIRGRRKGVAFPPGTDRYRHREGAPTTPPALDSIFHFP